MILEEKDIHDFEVAVERVLSEDRYRENLYGGYFDGYVGELHLNSWLARYPQVLMAGAALQEYVSAHRLPLYDQLVHSNFLPPVHQSCFRPYEGSWSLVTNHARYGVHGYRIERLRAALVEDDDELFDSASYRIAGIEDVARNAKRYVDNAVIDPTSFVSPKLWTPDNYSAQKSLLQESATPIIRQLQQEDCALESLHWRQLEDIVAEVLRNSGMEIHSVKEAPQGGRDIIARTEIAPGEQVTVAVEVKHRRTIGRPTLHTALHQNAQFPALMLVTSGRFSAGVLREASKPENRLRLFLKDGVAVRDMIRAYGMSH